MSASGLGAAIVSTILTVIGFVASPSAWLMVAAIIGLSGQHASILTSPESNPQVSQPVSAPPGDNDQIAAILRVVEQMRQSNTGGGPQASGAQCFNGGDRVALQGVASPQAVRIGDGTTKTVWVLALNKPICINDQSAPSADERQDSVSKIQIIGLPPPAETPIELTGTLSTGNLTRDYAVPTVIKVTSGRKLASAGGQSAEQGGPTTASTEDNLENLTRSYLTALQSALPSHGYKPGPVTGQMDAATAGAILAYQRDAGLPEELHFLPDLLATVNSVNFAKPPIIAAGGSSPQPSGQQASNPRQVPSGVSSDDHRMPVRIGLFGATETYALDEAWNEISRNGPCSRIVDARTDSPSDIAACNHHYAEEPFCLTYKDAANTYYDGRDNPAQSYQNEVAVIGRSGTSGLNRGSTPDYYNTTAFREIMLRLLARAYASNRPTLETKEQFSEEAYKNCMEGHPY